MKYWATRYPPGLYPLVIRKKTNPENSPGDELVNSQHSDTTATRFGMKYEGGSLPLDEHSGLKVSLQKDQIVIAQGKQIFYVPVLAITEITYGNDVHRRVGAAVGVAIVTLGIGAMLLLVKTKKHYVGITWNDTLAEKQPSKGGVVFKVGKGEYRGFIVGLEGLTGKKAVNTDASGPSGTSK